MDVSDHDHVLAHAEVAAEDSLVQWGESTVAMACEDLRTPSHPSVVVLAPST
jgi:hypothetical protein